MIIEIETEIERPFEMNIPLSNGAQRIAMYIRRDTTTDPWGSCPKENVILQPHLNKSKDPTSSLVVSPQLIMAGAFLKCQENIDCAT